MLNTSPVEVSYNDTILNVIPASNHTTDEPRNPWETPVESTLPQYFIVAGVVVGITLPVFLLQQPLGHRAIALIYLLAVVVMALFVGRGPTLFAATLSALFWDFFFLTPVAHLRIENMEDIIMFGTYFAVALVLGQLTSRVSKQERARRQGEERATALYVLARELSEAINLDQLAQKVAQEMERAFQAQIVVLLPDASQRLGYRAHPASTYEITGPEQPVIAWVFEQGRSAGKFANHPPEADTLFVPLTSGGRIMGVMGLNFSQPSPPSIQQLNLLNAFSQQIAIALDRHHLREESETAKRLAESERLSKTLLNSMSHEIRTPLAAIKSATGNLVEEGGYSESQAAMIGEIQEATDRLNRLVGNVLEITRLESGHVKPKLTQCDVGDLVHVAVKETRKELARHQVKIEIAPGLPLARMDYVLMQQALTNLLSNAATHTPPGTSVQVRARAENGELVLAVLDNGPGILPDSLTRIFDKFYRGPSAPTGGTGLGLSLVKGFVEAQGGQVKAENRAGGGAVFSIRLPLDKTGSTATVAN